MATTSPKYRTTVPMCPRERLVPGRDLSQGRFELNGYKRELGLRGTERRRGVTVVLDVGT